MAETPTASAHAVRVVVVYRHPLLKDIVVPALVDAGADVVASYPVQEFTLAALDVLRPDVVLVDKAAEGELGDFAQAVLFDGESDAASRVVAIGLAARAMVVCSRRVEHRYGLRDLLKAVMGATCAPRQ